MPTCVAMRRAKRLVRRSQACRTRKEHTEKWHPPNSGRSSWHSDTTHHVDIILVWHTHLLRLVPLVRSSPARVVVFLHGVEAWKRQDWFTHRLLRRVDLFNCDSQYTWEQFSLFILPTPPLLIALCILALGTRLRKHRRSPPPRRWR